MKITGTLSNLITGRLYYTSSHEGKPGSIYIGLVEILPMIHAVQIYLCQRMSPLGLFTGPHKSNLNELNFIWLYRLVKIRQNKKKLR